MNSWSQMQDGQLYIESQRWTYILYNFVIEKNTIHKRLNVREAWQIGQWDIHHVLEDNFIFMYEVNRQIQQWGIQQIKKKTLLKVGGRMPLFLFIFCFHNLQYRHTFNPIHTIHISVAVRRGLSPSPHRFVSSVGKTVPVVPSRESNSGLTYSKPTRYQLSNAAPSEQRRTITEQRRTILSNAAPYWATPHHTEQRRTMGNLYISLVLT